MKSALLSAKQVTNCRMFGLQE